MYKLVVLMMTLIISSVSLANQDPFVVDHKTNLKNNECSFSGANDSPYYLEKVAEKSNYDNFISIEDVSEKKAHIEFSDSSKVEQNLNIAVVSNGIVYHKDYNNKEKNGSKTFYGLCKSEVKRAINRSNKETLECFNEKSYIAKNKKYKEIIFKKDKEFKVVINNDNNNEAYFLVNEDAYLSGNLLRESNNYSFYQLCKKNIIRN